MIDIFLVIISVLMAVVGQLLMKQGMNAVGRIGVGNLLAKLSQTAFNLWVIGGLILYALSAVLWIIILSRRDLSYVYPLVAIGYFFVLFFSAVFFKEQVSLIRWLGVGVICLGIILVTRS